MQTLNMSVPRTTPLVQVQTTESRGFSPDEVAQRCVNRIIFISDDAPPAIRDQALAYKAHMEKLIAHFMREAIASDRTSVYNAIKDAGHPDLAEMIRRL